LAAGLEDCSLVRLLKHSAQLRLSQSKQIGDCFGLHVQRGSDSSFIQSLVTEAEGIFIDMR
jgi:hypothetical protein